MRGDVAQLEERCLCKADVRGSSPLISTQEDSPACTCGWGGDYSGRETPVPIPNTAVKPFSSDDTAGAALWENRALPLHPPVEAGFILYRNAHQPVTRSVASVSGTTSSASCSGLECHCCLAQHPPPPTHHGRSACLPARPIEAGDPGYHGPGYNDDGFTALAFARIPAGEPAR